MVRKKILIIGYGIVGKNVHKIFPDALVHDPKKGYIVKNSEFDLAFICVPTDMNPDGSCNTDIVESVIKEWKDKVTIFCIRSTVPPGFTEKMNQKAQVIFQPEYYGATQHANNCNYNFVILGGDRTIATRVSEYYKHIYTAELKILITDSRTAELAKYMENAWLATKVIFCNEFFRIAEANGVNYGELRELWLADPRINRSHTFVYYDTPYYNSHCLNKDVPAIIADSEDKGFDATFLRAVVQRNEQFKRG